MLGSQFVRTIGAGSVASIHTYEPVKKTTVTVAGSASVPNASNDAEGKLAPSWAHGLLADCLVWPQMRTTDHKAVMATLVSALWLFCLLFGVLPPAQADGAPPMVLHQVSPSAWYVQGLSELGSPANQNFISNAGFVVTPAGVVMIDALGSPALAGRLVAEIKKITPLPITHVLVTHYHPDHIYGLQVFKALGAKVVAQRAAMVYLNSETAKLRLAISRTQLFPWIDDNTRLVEPDSWLDSDQDLLLGGVLFQARALGPAHTPEDLAFYLPSEKVLFTGDLVFRNRIPFVGQADSRHWIAALDQLLLFDSKVIVPGHGPLSTDAHHAMQQTRDYLVYLRTTMRHAAEAMEPFGEAYQNTDWSKFAHLALFQEAHRMNAYNTYLLLEREAK